MKEGNDSPMKMKAIFGLLICAAFFITSFGISSQRLPEQGSGEKWSAYLGQMNWTSAKSKCASLGMRLPTRAELISAYKSRENKSWDQNQEVWYWTSEEYSPLVAYLVLMRNGDVYHGDNFDTHGARCIR